MDSLKLFLALKILQFVGAILNTLGFLTFFTFASLVPYRWPLIISGIAIIVVTDILTRLLLKRVGNSNPE